MKKNKKRAKKKQKNFLKENYSLSWNYLKESKNFIYIIVGVFFLFTLVGFFVPAPESIVEQILKFIQELLEKTQGMSQLELTNFIFLNNLQSSFFGLIFGVLFGIFPLIATVVNGYLLGFIASMSVEGEGFLILLRILPHGIFELPAIFISLALGLKLGINLIVNLIKYYFPDISNLMLVLLITLSILLLPLSFLFYLVLLIVDLKLRKRIVPQYKSILWSSIRVFLFIIIPLLIIAAIIEGTLIFMFS